MSPQIACPRGCIVALVAFVWFFSTVRFQMCPQSTCIRGCKVTLVAFVWFNDIVRFFLQDFHICILKTKVIIFYVMLHCHCMLCFAQMVASNWVKFIVDSNNHIFFTFPWHTFTFHGGLGTEVCEDWGPMTKDNLLLSTLEKSSKATLQLCTGCANTMLHGDGDGEDDEFTSSSGKGARKGPLWSIWSFTKPGRKIRTR